jgi:hypothetical protein
VAELISEMRYKGCDTIWGAILKHEVLEEASLAHVNRRLDNLMGYFLTMEDPYNGETVLETYASMPAVVSRAARLIKAGYRIGISSSATQFEDKSNGIGGSDY